MRLIKQTDEFVLDTEEEAIALIEKARQAANSEGYAAGRQQRRIRSWSQWLYL